MRYYLFISTFIINLAQANECKNVDPSELILNLKKLPHIFLSNTPLKSSSIFNEIIQCKDKLWNTKKTPMGTLPIYFYDANQKQLSMRNPENSEIINVSKQMEKEIRKTKKFIIDHKELNKIITWDRLPGIKEDEKLVINNSVEDANLKVRKEVQKISTKYIKLAECKKYITPNTLPFGKFDTDVNHTHIAGLCMHEELHMHQNKSWVDAVAPLGDVENEENISESMYYYHLILKYLLEASSEKVSGNDTKSKVALANAKYVYLKWKATNPISLYETDTKDEGTAQYIEIKASILYTNGCDTKDDVLNPQINQKLHELVARHSTHLSAYPTSAIASHLLENFNIANWRNKIEDTAV